MPLRIAAPQRPWLLLGAMLTAGCVSTPNPQPSRTMTTAPTVFTEPGLTYTPRPLPRTQVEPPPADRTSSLAHMPMTEPSPAAISTLWNHWLRYAKNVAATGQLYQATLADHDEDLIDHLIAKDAALRTEQEQAILYIALMEHAVVEYEFQREAAAAAADPNSPAEPEASLIPATTEVTSQSPQEVLAFLATEYALNIAHEITHNPYLNHPTIYHMSLNVLSYIKADPSLLTAIIDHSQAPAAAWSMLHEAILTIDDGAAIASPATNPPPWRPGMAKPEAEPLPPARQYSVGEFSEGDRIISRAKDLHSQQLFKEALAQLTEITPQSPHYTEAQNLLRRYSDDAVNQLRGEAAKLYQAQLKVLNIQTKIEFLQEGEQKLLTALREYPESKWVSKVRNNLAVIQQKLDELAKVAAEAS